MVGQEVAATVATCGDSIPAADRLSLIPALVFNGCRELMRDADTVREYATEWGWVWRWREDVEWRGRGWAKGEGAWQSTEWGRWRKG